MRLFIAIDIEPAIRERLATFVAGVRGFAPDARWVAPETFHVTLKFLGETAPDKAEHVKRALAAIARPPLDIRFAGTGFFPNPRSARVFWVGIEAGEPLTQLAAQVDDACSRLAFERERNPYHPHLTLARSGERASGNPHQHGKRPEPRFQRLAERLAAMPPPDFGTMTAREFYLYESKLGRGGAQCTRIERFELKP
jgi:2'-5' RNA ligase